MDVLIIGGTVFLGRAMVAEALAAGHTVTVFNRGKSGPAPAGVRQVTGDRTSTADLEQLRGERFDLVIDTCGYVPAEVAAAAGLLAGTCGHYSFVSSINAYPGWPQDLDYRDHVYGGDPDATRDDLPDGMDDSQSYGWLKVGCELAVDRAFGPARTSVLRAGCLAGPHDGAVGRLPWWVHRTSLGGEMLVPGAPDAPVSLVDARDVARFALLAVPGSFDVPGPRDRDTRADLVAGCQAATGSHVQAVFVTDEQWLVEQGVQFWTEVPLWIPDQLGPATFRCDADAAARAGMRWRPLADTIADTWAWQRGVDGGWQPSSSTPGLAADRERELLSAWHSRT